MIDKINNNELNSASASGNRQFFFLILKIIQFESPLGRQENTVQTRITDKNLETCDRSQQHFANSSFTVSVGVLHCTRDVTPLLATLS